MQPDGVFGHINNQARPANIELPREYIAVVNVAGAVATYMEQSDFVDITTILNRLFTQRKTDVAGLPFDNITTYAWYRFTKSDAGEVMMLLKKTTNIDEL